jgi:hypothetical protein
METIAMRVPSFALLRVCILVLVLLHSGCKKNSPDLTAPPNGDGTSGTPVSPSLRKAAIDYVTGVDSTLDWSNPMLAKQQLLQQLQNRSEFEASGANDDASVWARFTDGRLLIISNNRPANDTAAGPNSPGFWSNAPAGIPGGELPTGRKARLLNAMGTVFTNPLPVLESMFKAKGYDVTPGLGSIANLRTVNNDAVFYIDAHGGTGGLRNGTTEYAIWTSDPFDTVTDASLATLWKNGELVYFTAVNDRLIPFLPRPTTSATHFGITTKFVTNEMSFGQNCLIYFDACSSASPAASAFVTACLDKSVGTSAAYAGWTNPVDDNAAVVACYFVIDRLLGTNQDPRNRESPPQRPFTYPQVLAELASKNLNRSANGNATFTINPPTASFGFFAPSIERLTVDEQRHELDVIGLFGSDFSDLKVTLNDQPVTVQNSTPGQLTCMLDPTTQNTGGDVKVIIHGDTSNVVRLTEWKGQVMVSGTFPGSVGYSVFFDFHFRADVHSFRTAPGLPVFPYDRVGGDGMSDSKALCTVGGTMTDNFTVGGGCPQKIVETWSPAHDSATYTTGPMRSLGLVAEIRPQLNTMTVYFSVAMINFLTDNFADSMFCPDNPPQGSFFSAPVQFATYDTLEFQLSNTFDLIDPGPRKHPIGMLVSYGIDPNLPLGTSTTTLVGATTSYPPDPDAGQRPVVRSNRQPLATARR